MYEVNGRCTCADYAFSRPPGGWCKHRIARALAKRASQILKEENGADGEEGTTAPDSMGTTMKTEEDSTFIGYLKGYDVDGDTLTYEMYKSPTNGTLNIDSNGYFSYVPNNNYVGKDTFSYTVTDGSGKTDTGTFQTRYT